MKTYAMPAHIPVQDDAAPFLPHWHVRQVTGGEDTHFEVRNSLGAVIATKVRSLEHARLFALAPILLENIGRLAEEARGVLRHMVDVNEGSLDFQDVADDVDEAWSQVCCDAPAFARWMLEVEELCTAIGKQTWPVEGVARQARLEV